ncbi:GATA transcription factor 5 isoform X1 [Musa acuminata AAA Group]|uniref:GATA transcription factor 5 isoform X1 n=1 Tax=Musa acuminata AAA Group TaxID=214697 RepID=UPI0031E03CC3
MFHKTLVPFSSSSSPAPSLSSPFFIPQPTSIPLPLGPLQLPSPVPSLVYFNCSQVEREVRMEEALKHSMPGSSLYSGQQRLQQQQQNKVTVNEEWGWAAERGNLLGEEFSVDDLLDLGDYAENYKEAEAAKEVVEEVTAKAEAPEAGNGERADSNNSSPPSTSSTLSFQSLQPRLSEISLPAHDAEELEWVSLVIEGSSSEFSQCPGVAHTTSAPPPHGQTGTPAVAAAQGGSPKSPAVCGFSNEVMVPMKAKRSKRCRSAAAWSVSGPLVFADSSSITTSATSSSASSSCSSSRNTSISCLVYDRHPAAGADQSFLLYDATPPPAKNQRPKKRGRKPKPPATAASGSCERRCSHCGAQKTPQWRAGPLGAKTLCNACGVRFKSGRLLPEYRPACSPTFVNHIHSNSHRKVLEMRRKKEAELLIFPAAPPVPSF